MEDKTESIEELLRWVVSVDRRLMLMKSRKWHTMVKASDVTPATTGQRRTSATLKELDERGLIECLTPEKIT